MAWRRRTINDLSGGVDEASPESRAKFITSKLKAYKPLDVDIIMALNVLHHLNYDKGVLNAMFKHASTVVLEMPAKDLSAIDSVAQSYRFGKPTVASSHRDGRCIVVYSKAKPVALPGKFAYHPRQSAIKRRMLRMTQLALHWALICAFGVPVKIKRYLWMRLK